MWPARLPGRSPIPTAVGGSDEGVVPAPVARGSLMATIVDVATIRRAQEGVEHT